MESPTNHAKPTTVHRPRSAQNWVDFLLIAATVVTFLIIIVGATGHSRAKAQGQSSPFTIGLPVQTSEIPTDPGLIKARIRLAVGAPWS
jgi:hypothetical protein